MTDKELTQTPAYWNPDYFQSNPFGNDFNNREHTQSDHPSRIATHPVNDHTRLLGCVVGQKERV